MTIEKETKTKKFENIYHKSIINCMFTNSWLEHNQMQFFKKYDLSIQQFNVLRILKGQYPFGLKLIDIAQRMIDRNSNATRIIDKLEEKKWVSRTINPQSRREVNIVITDSGMQIVTELDEKINHFLEDVFKQVNHEELEQLNLILDKIRH